MDPTTVLGIAESVANPLMAHLTNVKNRKFAREMYGRQRQDALADWSMQNEYNSPRAQMQRLQEAGLNPNIIYGQMSEAQPVRSSSSSGGGAEAPHTSGRTFMDIYTMKIQKAQADLLAKEMTVKDADIALKNAQAISTIAGSELSKVQKDQITQNMGFQSQLFPVDLESKKVGVDKQRQEIQLAVNEDVRRTLTTMTNSWTAAEQIASLIKGRQKTDADIKKIEKEIELMRKDGTIKDLEINWRRTGQNPYNPQQLKLIDGILERLGFDSGRPFMDDVEELRNIRKEKTKPPGYYRHNTRTWQATDSR